MVRMQAIGPDRHHPSINCGYANCENSITLDAQQQYEDDKVGTRHARWEP